MIVVPVSDILVCITQPDHAFFSGQLAALWRRGGLPQHPHRDEIVFAAREHDNGWRETDAAPHVDPARGRPHDFLSIPWRERFEIWRRGIQRFAAESPRAALLIAEHAAVLHREHRGKPELADFFALLDERQAELRETTGISEEEVETDYRFVYFTDLVSLAACSRWSEPFERTFAGDRLCGAFDSGVIHLEPFPLAGATTFRVPCRRIPQRAYTSDLDLAVELAGARWQEQTVRVVPG